MLKHCNLHYKILIRLINQKFFLYNLKYMFSYTPDNMIYSFLKKKIRITSADILKKFVKKYFLSFNLLFINVQAKI